MKVSEIPFGDLKVGDICISQIGNRGIITGVYPENGREGVRYDTVTFEWSSGNKSVIFHMSCDPIEYIGKE